MVWRSSPGYSDLRGTSATKLVLSNEEDPRNMFVTKLGFKLELKRFGPVPRTGWIERAHLMDSGRGRPGHLQARQPTCWNPIGLSQLAGPNRSELAIWKP